MAKDLPQTQDQDSDTPPPPFAIDVKFEKVVCFARQQAGIPFIRDLSVVNKSRALAPDAVLRLGTDPAFAVEKTLRIGDFAPSSRFAPDETELDIALSARFLSSVRERVNGSLRVEIVSGGKVLYGESLPLSILAYNEWTPDPGMPELLVSFCSPNQPVVSRILARAADILRGTTGSPALDGYQSSDPKRALRIAESIFLSIKELGIVYAVPPASFEKQGQKIRFPEEVVASRLGTCLDTALLFSSCIEAAGLSPIFVIDKNHAYAGCWLGREAFDQIVERDIQHLRKLTSGTNPHLIVFETTFATGGNSGNFADAEEFSRKHLQDETEFRFAVDVMRARAICIRPLPVAIKDGNIVVDLSERPVDKAAPIPKEAVEERFVEVRKPSPAPQAPTGKPTPSDRVARWCDELLDLSLRNRLLNFGKTGSVEIFTHAINLLEDKLAAKEEFAVVAENKGDPRSKAIVKKRQREDIDEERLKDDLASRKIRVACGEDELEKRLVAIARDARIDIEEGGANTLFLALGVMEWRDPTKKSGKAERVFKAPILLVPVALSRQSVRGGFKLRRLDEETRVNVTLLEKLRRDFNIEIPGVNPPPEDDFGVDVPQVMRLFRDAVLHEKGFEVREEAHLGIFQFTKFLLWKDLADRAKLLKRNPLVAHLIDHPRDPFVSTAKLKAPIEPKNLDLSIPPSKNFCILDYDSSQLSAVASASAGMSLVMIGPPGTGKSQTIGNMIANLIATGKTVLFVAEKRAALEVVQKRLEKAGLGPFLLEIHSNKTGKGDVVEKLRKAVDFVPLKEPSEWEKGASELRKVRDQLNDLVRALHRRLPNGLSAYQCLGMLVGEGEVPHVTFRAVHEHNQEYVSDMRKKVAELALGMADIQDYPNHPLADVRHAVWSEEWQRQSLESIGVLKKKAVALQMELARLCGIFGIENRAMSLSRLNDLSAFVSSIRNPPAANGALALEPSTAAVADLVADGTSVIRSRLASREKLNDWKQDELLKLDVAAIHSEWIDANMAFFLTRPMRKSKILKSLAAYSDANDPPEAEEFEIFLNRISELQGCEKLWREADKFMAPVFGKVWNGGSPEYGALEKAQAWHKTYTLAIIRLAASDSALATSLRRKAADLMDKNPAALAKGGEIAAAIDGFVSALAGFSEIWQRTSRLLELDEERLNGATMPDEAVKTVARVEKAAGELRRWCHLQKLRAEAASMELSPLAEALESGRVKPADLPKVFELSYAKAALEKIVNDEKSLANFFGDEQMQKIRDFNSLDEKFSELAHDVVLAQAATRRPQISALGEKPANFGEIGILNNELNKRGRFKPTRKLFTEIQTILPKLKPCFLMSPLSVAQYLGPDYPPFDVVIFDEASQIPVADAIGAMARGTQVIVAGDPKQLPPTSFFQRGGEAGLDEYGDDDLPEQAESILDECRAAGLPEVRLSWHYRSRRESLIAFSNREYYSGGLITCPEPCVEDKGVRIVRVDGAYDRGKTNTNRKEAEAIVAAIAAHYRDPAQKGVSLGIVTFNSEQQKLIENLLDEARRTDETIDRILAEDLREPLFIKNLENVQGDERDIIFFSTTYGRDEKGAMDNNFGPLNKSGGERRLNVAVTRARDAVFVFTSLKPEDIDVAKAANVGPKHLRAYLEYAARSSDQSVATSGESKADPYAEFEGKVAESLRSAGWTVHEKIGRSARRVDLAVVDTRKAGEYAIGIECDGATYRDAPTARDRDHLRRKVMENMRWRTHRVWSSEWYHDLAKEKQKLFEIVKEAAGEAPLPKPAPVVPVVKAEEVSAREASSEESKAASPESAKKPARGGRKPKAAKAVEASPVEPVSAKAAEIPQATAAPAKAEAVPIAPEAPKPVAEAEKPTSQEQIPPAPAQPPVVVQPETQAVTPVVQAPPIPQDKQPAPVQPEAAAKPESAPVAKVPAVAPSEAKETVAAEPAPTSVQPEIPSKTEKAAGKPKSSEKPRKPSKKAVAPEPPKQAALSSEPSKELPAPEKAAEVAKATPPSTPVEAPAQPVEAPVPPTVVQAATPPSKEIPAKEVKEVAPQAPAAPVQAAAAAPEVPKPVAAPEAPVQAAPAPAEQVPEAAQATPSPSASPAPQAPEKVVTVVPRASDRNKAALGNIAAAMKNLDPYNTRSVAKLRDAIMTIADVDGPVSITLLCAQISKMMGAGKVQPKLLKRIGEILPREITKTTSGGQIYLWPKEVKPESYNSFRPYSNGDEKRPIDNICPQEQANAMASIVLARKLVSGDDLVQATASVFGHEAVTPQMRETMKPALSILEKMQGIEKTDKGYAIKA